MDCKRQTRCLASIAAALVCVWGATAVATAEVPGIVKDKPAKPPFVKVEQGYMVPYTVTVKTSDGLTVAIEMVPVPGGTFKMGSPNGEAGRKDSEGPQFEVIVRPMWVAKYETSWDQYDPWVDLYQYVTSKGVKPAPADKNADAVSFPTPLYDQEGVPMVKRMGRKGGYPAASMTQLAARQYTKWLSKSAGQFYRLPTAAEWEYACRAGTTTAFSFGDDPDKLADHGWYFDNSEWPAAANRGHKDFDAGYRKVGAKNKPNAWGLHDMHGNVAEWVIDQYDPDHYKQFAGKGPLKAADVINWPTKRYPREVRGGHWDADAKLCRSASRLGSDSEWKEEDPQVPRSEWWYTSFFIGFRIVRPLDAPDAAARNKFWDPLVDRIKEISQNPKEKQVRVLLPLPK